MKFHASSRRHEGVALIIVMIAIVVLGILAAAFAYSMKVETHLAATANSNQRLVWLGRSGVELARWVLVQEASIPGEPYDAKNQIWAGGSGSPGESNSVLTGLSLTDYPIGEGTVSLKIEDLERYANINTASSEELHQALTVMGVDADSISVVSDSIQDWVDPDDAPRIAGAEDDYYQSLNPPYNCKNAPIDDVSELLLIKGIWNQPEIFFGGTASNHAPSAFQHKLGVGRTPNEIPDYPFGLKDVFTPFSNGRINVNTADANVLQLIPGIDANVAASILALRAGPDGADGTEDDTPFQSVNQLTMANIDSRIVGQLSRYCTVRSATFKVTVTAKTGLFSRDYEAILYRNGRNVQVVSFYWETENKH
ncbi:MAG TPA: general secretion pathway protein GspK [Desulfuromonadaceae bacterium]|nr:general secretion pathway protein GspK [Desulfuromonadaceae bacterium]